MRDDDAELIDMLKPYTQKMTRHAPQQSAHFKTDGRQLPGANRRLRDIGRRRAVFNRPHYVEDGSERYVVKKSHNDPVELGNIVADEMEKIGAKDIIDMINENNANQ